MKNLYIIIISPLLLLACNERNTTRKEVASFKKESETWTDIIKIKKPVIQSYKIDNTNDTIIVGEKGTIFFIPKSAFKNISISKNIEIQFSEFYSYMDFMSSNLTTTSNDQILETRGMVNFEAYQNGKLIVWDEKVPLKIYFPRMDTISDFITFSGYQDSLSNINWIPENTKNRSVRNNLDINYGLYNYTIGIGFLRDCKIEILDRTVKIGSFDIDYKLKNRDDDIFKYFNAQFKLDKDLLNRFCQSKEKAVVKFDINEAGKIVNAKLTDSSNVKVGKELIKFLTDLPPFDLGSMLVTKGRNNIGNNFYDSPDEFVKDFKNKYKLNSQKLLQKIDKNELNYYILYSTKLGWINCDRFYKIPKDQKRDLIVKVPDDKTKVYLLYKTIRGIQSEMAFNKKAVFKELPLNSEIKIVVIHDEDNKTEIRKSDIIIGRQSEIDFKKMKTVPLINLDKELEL